MVDRRCAITSVVRFSAICLRSAWMAFSDFESKAEVASSKIRMRGFLSIARAMATRYFSPPKNLRPRSPTSVSYLSGSVSIKSWIWACCAARMTSSCVARVSASVRRVHGTPTGKGEGCEWFSNHCDWREDHWKDGRCAYGQNFRLSPGSCPNKAMCNVKLKSYSRIIKNGRYRKVAFV